MTVTAYLEPLVDDDFWRLVIGGQDGDHDGVRVALLVERARRLGHDGERVVRRVVAVVHVVDLLTAQLLLRELQDRCTW